MAKPGDFETCAKCGVMASTEYTLTDARSVILNPLATPNELSLLILDIKINKAGQLFSCVGCTGEKPL